MNTCPFCHAELEEGTVFCPNCGARLDGVSPAPDSAAPEAAAEGGEMAFCPNCGAQISAESTFCPNCGVPLEPAPAEPEAPVYEMIYCPNCGVQTSTEFAYCQNCGAPLQPEADPAQKPVKPHKSKLPILIAGVCALVVVVVAAVLLLPRGGGKSYSLYVKNEEIFYTDFSKKDPLEVTSHLLDSSSLDVRYMDMSDISYSVSFNENKTRLFFPDRVEDDAEGFPLYYRDINKPKKEAERIDTDVVEYSINSAGTQVVYVKGDDGILYTTNLKDDKEKIDSEVTYFFATDDCKKVLYLNEDGDMYLWQNGDKEKLASDVSYVSNVVGQLEEIYYTRDEALYHLTVKNGDNEKIASDASVIRIYDSGEIYYTKSEDITVNLADYVDDDLAATDASFVEPEYPDYPYSWDYDSSAAYQAAYEQYQKDVDAYYEAMDQYYEKRDRDDLREQLKDYTIDITQYSLYYYNGSDSEKVSDSLVSSWNYDCAADVPVITVLLRSEEDPPMVKMSELESTYDLEWEVRDALTSEGDWYIVSGTNLSPLEANEPQWIIIADDGKTLYFVDDVNDEAEGDLYKATVRNGAAENIEMMDSEVNSTTLGFTSDDEFYYFKNISTDNSKGDLYVDGKEIDYDVRLYSLAKVGNSYLYFTDWNSDKQYGTLVLNKNGKKETVADDVHARQITDDDDILYISDFSSSSYRGTLSLYNNGKPKKIDEDVNAILYNYDKIGGAHYA